MRKSLVLALSAFLVLVALGSSAFAQTPAPKVTITGLFDQVISAGRNFYDGNFARDGDHEWYARTRFRPDFEFAVGRNKAVLGIELDLMYGQGRSNDGGFPGNNSGHVCGFVGGCKFGTGGGLDLNTDVAGLFEIKWIYTEFDLTGKDSLLPFIPVQTVARAGGQPFATLANYKITYAMATSPACRRSRRSRQRSSSASSTSCSRTSSPAVTGRWRRRGRTGAKTTR
jgi:hypothetical protein